MKKMKLCKHFFIAMSKDRLDVSTNTMFYCAHCLTVYDYLTGGIKPAKLVLISKGISDRLNN